jgi:hypothetical protein
MTPLLIYCAAGNSRFAEIAIRRGFQYGACMPNTIYFPPAFTDQDWNKFNLAKTEKRREELRAGYFAVVEKYRPRLATVLDWEREEQLPEVLHWAEVVSQWVTEAVIIIPKVIGGIKRLPRIINGKQVRLGYSAASSFSGTPVSLGEFRGWPVHCLGGSVSVQMDVASKTDCVSADGNFRQQQARERCQFYSPSRPARHKGWPRLSEAGLYIRHDAPYLAFELTCIAEPMAWRGCSGQEIWDAQLAYLDSAGITTDAIPAPLFTTVETKCCSKCKRTLPLSQYHKKDKTRLRSDCVDCYNLYRAQQYEQKPKPVRPLRTPEQREQHRIATRRARLAKTLRRVV